MDVSQFMDEKSICSKLNATWCISDIVAIFSIFPIYLFMSYMQVYFSFSGDGCGKCRNPAFSVKSASIPKILKIDAYRVQSGFDRFGTHYLDDLHRQLRLEILCRLVAVRLPALECVLLTYSVSFVIFINYKHSLSYACDSIIRSLWYTDRYSDKFDQFCFRKFKCYLPG